MVVVLWATVVAQPMPMGKGPMDLYIHGPEGGRRSKKKGGCAIQALVPPDENS